MLAAEPRKFVRVVECLGHGETPRPRALCPTTRVECGWRWTSLRHRGQVRSLRKPLAIVADDQGWGRSSVAPFKPIDLSVRALFGFAEECNDLLFTPSVQATGACKRLAEGRAFLRRGMGPGLSVEVSALPASASADARGDYRKGAGGETCEIGREQV